MQQRVRLVFSKDGELIACLAGDIGPERAADLIPAYCQSTVALIRNDLASQLIAKHDEALTKRRYEIAWGLGEKYLAGHEYKATGEKSITANNRVLLATKCGKHENDTAVKDGTFECQFAPQSSQVLHCSVMSADGQLKAQIFPSGEEYGFQG